MPGCVCQLWAIVFRILSFFAILSFVSPASAATWWLVVVGDGKGTYDTDYSFQLPMETSEQCEVAGSKLEMSANSGKFASRGVEFMVYECVQGK
jgi:hypothetical protein